MRRDERKGEREGFRRGRILNFLNFGPEHETESKNPVLKNGRNVSASTSTTTTGWPMVVDMAGYRMLAFSQHLSDYRREETDDMSRVEQVDIWRCYSVYVM